MPRFRPSFSRNPEGDAVRPSLKLSKRSAYLSKYPLAVFQHLEYSCTLVMDVVGTQRGPGMQHSKPVSDSKMPAVLMRVESHRAYHRGICYPVRGHARPKTADLNRKSNHPGCWFALGLSNWNELICFLIALQRRLAHQDPCWFQRPWRL